MVGSLGMSWGGEHAGNLEREKMRGRQQRERGGEQKGAREGNGSEHSWGTGKQSEAEGGEGEGTRGGGKRRNACRPEAACLP